MKVSDNTGSCPGKQDSEKLTESTSFQWLKCKAVSFNILTKKQDIIYSQQTHVRLCIDNKIIQLFITLNLNLKLPQVTTAIN